MAWDYPLVGYKKCRLLENALLICGVSGSLHGFI